LTEELVVSTPEQYTRLTTKKIQVNSGAVFHVQAMGANSVVYLLGIMPEKGLDNQKELIKFVAKYLDGIVEHIVQPCIVAPRVEHLAFADVISLLMGVMEITGFTEGDASFPVGKDGGDA